MAATFSENIAAALRQIALDQIAQDLEIQQTYATKDELNNLGGGGSETAVAIEQMVKFYNGYMATSLDYRDYLNLSANDVLNSIYAFCNSYSGATT